MPFLIFALSSIAFAQTCPGGEDEAPFKVKTAAGPTLIVCGYEDHEVTPGHRAFTDFKVYSVVEKGEPKEVYASDPGDTHQARALETKGLALDELWYLADQPQPALRRTLTCDATSCRVGETSCLLKIKSNPHPGALGLLEGKLKKKQSLGENGEDLLDQVWAQALAGDAKAARFVEGAIPKNLDPSLTEVFESNRQKLKDARAFKCVK